MVVSSAELTLVAGDSISFDLEIRTTDKEKRSNRWFESPEEAIKFTFEKEVVHYTISKGSVKGRYVIEMSPKVSGKNKIFLEIDG